jgi:hypothetical protein
VHNLITRAAFETLVALRDERVMNEAMGEKPGHRSDSTTERIESAGEPLVRALLFSDEAKLTDEIRGTSSFTADFAKSAVRDSKGRSLRDFDLHQRLFKYPCSYMIYSGGFQALPEPVHAYVLHRLYQVLSGRDDAAEFSNVSDDTRDAILEILRETVRDLPSYWNR